MSDWIRRLVLGKWWFYLGRLFGGSHLQVQRCDRCGKIPRASWWDDTNSVWEAVAGNLHGFRHGCFCIQCFTSIAAQKGLLVTWRPTAPQPKGAEGK